MPPPRVLLPLCGLLFALAITAVFAEAPLYGSDEAVLNYWTTPAATTQYAQVLYCSGLGGSLVPMSTDAIYVYLRTLMDSVGVPTLFSYMGGSSMLSSSACTTTEASLRCIWFWDQGRYAGTENAVPFFAGNRDANELPGAGMISTAVNNYWRVLPTGARCPCKKMERYGAVLRDNGGSPHWSDTSSIAYSYGTVPTRDYRTFCLIDRATSTTTTTAEPTVRKSRGVNLPLVVGLSVGAAVILIVTIAVIVSLVCCGGCYCIAGSSGVAAARSTAAPSRRGSMSRADSRRSRMDELDNRSFRDSSRSEKGSSRYSGVYSFGDDERASQRDGMVPFSSSQYMQTLSTANMAPQMMPPQMLPMQQQQMLGSGGSQMW